MIRLRSPSPSDAAPKSGASGPIISVEQRLGMDEVGIGVVAAEIGQRRAVDHGAGGGAKRALEDRLGIGSGHRAHGVEAHGEARREKTADRVEVEQGLHQRLIVGDRIDHLDGHVLQLRDADAVEIDVGRIRHQDAVDDPGPGEDRLGHLLRRRAAIGDVELDAEVAVGPPGLWLAERMMPPAVRFLRMRWEAAGVESRPPWPTMTRARPLPAAIFRARWMASRLKKRPSPPMTSVLPARPPWRRGSTG